MCAEAEARLMSFTDAYIESVFMRQPKAENTPRELCNFARGQEARLIGLETQ